MSLLFYLRQTALGCSLALALPAVALAQAGYSTNGGEFPVAGSLPGDQVRPQLSLNSSGGYLVWQDNATCPFGLGISALALNTNFSPAGARFRVNKVGAGDQENPRVSLLNNGGAAFVWQTRSWRGFYNVYARFLSRNHTWLASDLRVNANAGNFAKPPNPTIATLANGSSVVLWASFNQTSRNSMQDIYGELFSPAGQRISAEFLVNQFTLFNQRTPAIAALAGGGFVVAWVSEQQRLAAPDGVTSTTISANSGGVAINPYRPSVDIYARIYDASGQPAGSEFLVNSGSDVCANPAITAAPDGGFLIAWSQKDSQVPSNAWDVYSRPFSSSGTAGAVRRLNSWVFGDQKIPQLSAIGTNCLALWTSLRQDGGMEGVFGQFLQVDGSPVGSEFRLNTTTAGSQKDAALASDNYGRFLSVWTSYSPSNHSFDLVGQTCTSTSFVPLSPANLYASPPTESFTDPAPSSGGGSFVHEPPPGSPSAGPGLDFPDSIAFPGLPNPLAALPGAYNGLFFDPHGVSAASAGFFTAKLTSRYSYSAKLMFGGRTYSVSGKFDNTGTASGSIRRGAGLPDLTVELQLVHLDSGADQIRGSVSDWLGTWQADLMADRLVFNKSNKATYAGDYTMVVPPAANGPDGSGFGTIKVSASGTLKWSATLADGSKVTQGAALSAQGDWPLYASLYRGKGLLTSWVRLANNDLGGRLIWIKPRGASAPAFPGSFTNSLDAAVSRYNKTATLNLFQSGSLSFTGGTLNTPLTKALTFDPRGRLMSPAARELKLSINASSGLFRGSAVLSQPAGKIAFQGVLLENGNFGAGFFQSRGLSGQTYWSPGP